METFFAFAETLKEEHEKNPQTTSVNSDQGLLSDAPLKTDSSIDPQLALRLASVCHSSDH